MNAFTAVEVLFLNILLIPIWIITAPTEIDDYIRFITPILLLFYVIFTRIQFFNTSMDRKIITRLVISFILMLGLNLLTGFKTFVKIFL